MRFGKIARGRALGLLLGTVAAAIPSGLPSAFAAGPVAQTLGPVGFGACVKPGVPVCMDDTTTFVNADKMTSCQGEVKEYVDQTMGYLKCLNDMNTSTGQELTRNVGRFNCRLSGGRDCG